MVKIRNYMVCETFENQRTRNILGRDKYRQTKTLILGTNTNKKNLQTQNYISRQQKLPPLLKCK